MITWSAKLLEATAAELAKQTAHLSRGDLARQSLEQFGALVLVRDAEEAVALANEIAAEHLHLAVDEPDPDDDDEGFDDDDDEDEDDEEPLRVSG